MGTYNRGTKTSDLYVLHYTNMPAIACYAGFIDNSADHAKLVDPAYRDKAAKAYVHATQTYKGETTHDPIANIIIDNTDARFYAPGSWWTGTSASQKYGADYRCHDTRLLSDCAVWNVPQGTWVVSAWWSGGANRSNEAPYILCSGDGSDQEWVVNQQIDGGRWNPLNTWPFTSGGCVKLSCWAEPGYVVIADAIKLEPYTW